MKKTLNKDTGEVTFSFTDKEIKKLKIPGRRGCFRLELGHSGVCRCFHELPEERK